MNKEKEIEGAINLMISYVEYLNEKNEIIKKYKTPRIYKIALAFKAHDKLVLKIINKMPIENL